MPSPTPQRTLPLSARSPLTLLSRCFASPTLPTLSTRLRRLRLVSRRQSQAATVHPYHRDGTRMLCTISAQFSTFTNVRWHSLGLRPSPSVFGPWGSPLFLGAPTILRDPFLSLVLDLSGSHCFFWPLSLYLFFYLAGLRSSSSFSLCFPRILSLVTAGCTRSSSLPLARWKHGGTRRERENERANVWRARGSPVSE